MLGKVLPIHRCPRELTSPLGRRLLAWASHTDITSIKSPLGGIKNVAPADPACFSVDEKSGYLWSQKDQSWVVSTLLGQTSTLARPSARFPSSRSYTVGTGSQRSWERFMLEKIKKLIRTQKTLDTDRAHRCSCPAYPLLISSAFRTNCLGLFGLVVVGRTLPPPPLTMPVACCNGKSVKRGCGQDASRATHTSKCSFQNGFRDFFTVLDANFSTPSTDTTTNGSGTRNRFRFGSPLALRTSGGAWADRTT